MIALLLAVVLPSFAPCAEASEGRQQSADERDTETRKTLETIKVDIQLDEASLADAVDFIREISGLAFHFDPVGAPAPKDLKFSMKARDAVLGSALRDALRVNEMDYVVLDGLVIITSIKGRDAIEAGPKSDELRKDKELWRQLSARATIAGGTTLAEAVKKLATESGLKFKADALTQEELGEKVQGDLPELTTISNLRMIA